MYQNTILTRFQLPDFLGDKLSLTLKLFLVDPQFIVMVTQLQQFSFQSLKLFTVLLHCCKVETGFIQEMEKKNPGLFKGNFHFSHFHHSYICSIVCVTVSIYKCANNIGYDQPVQLYSLVSIFSDSNFLLANSINLIAM